MEEKNKHIIYINVVPYTANTTTINGITANTTNSETELFFGILGSDNIVRDYYDKDFYINLPLYKTYKIEEYVDVKQEENIETLERQQFNPYFIDLGFFDTITRNKINHGSELSNEQVEYIKSVRPDVANINIKSWFETIGKSELPWFKGTDQEVTINDISEVQSFSRGVNVSIYDIVGKAKKYPIDINS